MSKNPAMIIKINIPAETQRAIRRVLKADQAGAGYTSTDGEKRDRWLRRALDAAREARGARRFRTGKPRR